MCGRRSAEMFHRSFKGQNMLILLVTASAFMASTAAAAFCDPLTEYAGDPGQCCKLCPPGTSMKVKNCENPICENCGDDEFQDKPNNESKCKLQPYCDPNKNFEVSGPGSPSKQLICTCKQGFHCSSKNCITCVPHQACPVGSGVVSKGDHKNDSACEKCQDGTFSNESSSEAPCLKWTECSWGFKLEQKGTSASDNICVENRSHKIAIIVGVLVGIMVVVGIGYMIWKKKSRWMKEKTKGCVEFVGGEREITEEPLKTPVENEDFHGVSENGNFVTQELGKGEILSRQESQMETMCETQSFQ